MYSVVDSDPHQFAEDNPKCTEYEPIWALFLEFWVCIWILEARVWIRIRIKVKGRIRTSSTWCWSATLVVCKCMNQSFMESVSGSGSRFLAEYVLPGGLYDEKLKNFQVKKAWNSFWGAFWPSWIRFWSKYWYEEKYSVRYLLDCRIDVLIQQKYWK